MAEEKLKKIEKAVRWLDTFEMEHPIYEDLENVINQIRDILDIPYGMS